MTQSISVFWYLRFENLAAYLTLKGLTAVPATDMNLGEKISVTTGYRIHYMYSTGTVQCTVYKGGAGLVTSNF